jgi:GT2 family glycosyltransferase
MTLSIIIVNYNVRHFLEQALFSVEKAIKNIDAEVFVVDNNSVDGSPALVAEKFPWVKLIINRKNTGFSVANNQAIKLATGKYILLLNPDTIVEEDTFIKVVDFMNNHPEAGALGVRMLDGKGKFLPESKRGFPTPMVAFYKIFGLSALFPKSKTFGKYHLKYLNPNENHEVEVLSGAFMLLRKSVLDIVGLLDEEFFMYGEDIDLSYRILKAGYKNYYFSGTQIIHYKGESTKKVSLNYVKTFYQAMLIFAQKHFSKGNLRLFSFLISIAIYFRAGVSVILRLFQKTIFPLTEGILIYGVIQLIKWYWETQHKYVSGGGYPLSFDLVAAPIYVGVYLFFLKLTGAYSTPYRSRNIISAAFLGFITIATVSYLFPEINYSRAIVGLTSMFTVFVCIFNRAILNLFSTGNLFLADQLHKKVLLVGDIEEASRVVRMIRKEMDYSPEIVGIIYSGSINNEDQTEVLGTIDQLEEAIEVYRVDEVIFCNKSMPTRTIIEEMSKLFHHQLTFKIVPPGADYLIGPNQIHASSVSFADAFKLFQPDSRIKKRMFDIGFSLGMLLAYPITFWIYRNPLAAITNLFSVLFGKYHIVGYINYNSQSLPKIKHGILNMRHLLNSKRQKANTDPGKLDTYYARTYSVELDLQILLRGIRLFGG